MKTKGLTLVELLIVISIMLILTGVLLPNLSDTRKQARDRKRLADMRSIQTALQLYKNDQSDGAEPYPTVFPTPGTEWSSGTVVYMKSFPKDPLYDQDTTNPKKYEYHYTYDSSNNSYILYGCLERSESFGTAVAVGICPGGFKYQIETE